MEKGLLFWVISQKRKNLSKMKESRTLSTGSIIAQFIREQRENTDEACPKLM